MKIKKSYIAYPVLIFFICFAILANWSAGANFINTILRALSPFITGAAIAYIVNIVMSAYERLYDKFISLPILLKVKRPLSMILAYATFVFVVFLIFTIVLPDLIASVRSLLSINPKDIQAVIRTIQNNKLVSKVLATFGSDAQLSKLISGYSRQILNQFLSVLTNVLTSVTSIASTLISIFVSIVFSMYVLASKEKLSRQFNLLVDTYLGKYAKTVHYLVEILHRRFHGFFVGQTLEAMILGTLTAAGMSLLHIPYAATVGVMIAFTALIPVVGPYIGVTIGTILILTQSLSQALVFVVFVVLLQQFEGNVIYPRVVGSSIGLPSMWVLLAITVGAALGGIVGMLIAVPILASIYQIIKDHVYKKQTQKNQEN
ncbi:AI-2E family transporter [Streptococcus macacae]|uniref:Membrane protein n=1 Tax=Streptococcus macacae NCTC 11558 TaxID=764298 RepID=G5JUE7_9STRE|nr:AI-2E family transporter [Streptococcus macacae]EHJ51655.1 putative membrane protein [Streptococcus macacae NCTC 11558]SUN78510.1 permease [Streptococcus macacae NCTC 11558]